MNQSSQSGTKFDTRNSDLSRVDKINELRTEAYYQLRQALFQDDEEKFFNASVDYLNGLKTFYRVVKEHAESEDDAKKAAVALDEAEKTVEGFEPDLGGLGVNPSKDKLKEVEKALTDAEDEINELRRSVGLSIVNRDNTPEGEELL